MKKRRGVRRRRPCWHRRRPKRHFRPRRWPTPGTFYGRRLTRPRGRERRRRSSPSPYHTAPPPPPSFTRLAVYAAHDDTDTVALLGLRRRLLLLLRRGALHAPPHGRLGSPLEAAGVLAASTLSVVSALLLLMQSCLPLLTRRHARLRHGPLRILSITNRVLEVGAIVERPAAAHGGGGRFLSHRLLGLLLLRQGDHTALLHGGFQRLGVVAGAAPSCRRRGLPLPRRSLLLPLPLLESTRLEGRRSDRGYQRPWSALKASHAQVGGAAMPCVFSSD